MVVKLKKLLILLSIFTVVFALAACGDEGELAADLSESEIKERVEERLHVMVTMFAQYDFARQVGGEHVDVQRLVAPGVDVHAFDPTPGDIIAINAADLFIYTGVQMEPWVHRILESLDRDDLIVLDVSTGVRFLPWYGEHAHDHHHDHHDEEEAHDHHHDHYDEEEAHDHHHDHHDEEEAHDHHHDHSHDYDPHIWTSPINAIVMVRNIQEYLTALLPEHAQYFAENAATLIAELEEVDQEFRDLMANAKRTVIYHSGRFAMHYLMYEYGIDFVAAAMETEPDPALVARIITEIKAYQIPVIFHEELVNPQTAEMIAAETGAQALTLHTIHNVSADEITAGATYVSLMRLNIEALRIALN